MALREYARKRKFPRTPEPRGRAVRRHSDRAPLFVIQKHAARRLHYDFRLEADGVLKSWAVPKGLPLRKGEKHLAIHVEDHPLDYATFEGVIPSGNYGAGSVMVWDIGTYAVEGDHLTQALRAGRIHLSLAGKKLHGDWSLIRLRPTDDHDQWLIIKRGADQKTLSHRTEAVSALSGRDMRKIADGNGKTSADPPQLKSTRREVPGFIAPMKALLVSALPRAGQWIHEIKFDGMRVIAVKRGNRVRLFSRTHRDVTAQFPTIAAALSKLAVARAVLDGEIVALDEAGRSSFQLLQPFMQARQPDAAVPIFCYLFDLLDYDGKNLRELPIEERRQLLKSLLSGHQDPLRFSDDLAGRTADLLREVRRLGLEGLIGKRLGSVYEPDRRSGAWIKLKTVQEQEFVIGGYTVPQGSRQYFGALLLGYYEKGKLRFASKVGTGFNEALLKELHGRFQKLERADSPFAALSADRARRLGKSLWLQPKLVCQVRFSEWTRDGGLRQPVFLGLRSDKSPRQVSREKPAKP